MNMVQFSSGVLLEQGNFTNKTTAPVHVAEIPKPVGAVKEVLEATKEPAPAIMPQSAPVNAATPVSPAVLAAQRAAEEAARLDAQAAAAYAAAQVAAKKANQ